MQRYVQYRDPARILAGRVFLLALVAVLIFGILGAWGAYQKERESRAMRDTAESERDDLESRKAHLEATINDLSTDRGREAALRERYTMAKKGEGLIVIVDPVKVPVAATSSPWYMRLKWW